jgi:hypothetical protein
VPLQETQSHLEPVEQPVQLGDVGLIVVVIPRKFLVLTEQLALQLIPAIMLAVFRKELICMLIPIQIHAGNKF